MKHEIQTRFIMELKIHEISDDVRYEDGVKYSLVFIDLKNKRRVLMDNHAPKGHHFHLDDKEYLYEYLSDDDLIEKFKSLVMDHFGVKI